MTASFIKKPEEIEILREGGRRLAAILRCLAGAAEPGMTEAALDHMARELIAAEGDEPAFLGYRPAGARRSFPAALCVSVNDAVVHGIPGERPFQGGDIVGLDLGIRHQGLYTDAALTIGIGAIDDAARKLLAVTEEALAKGISAARAGATTGDIGYTIQSFVEPFGYGIVRDLAGHGVGYAQHEFPQVPNYGKAGKGERILPGMVLALEPMLNEGGAAIILGDDKFTIRTADGSRSAHFEHTIVITEDGPEILTKE